MPTIEPNPPNFRQVPSNQVDNDSSDNNLRSPNFLRLTPRVSSPHHSLSSLQITLGNNYGIDDYILLPRGREGTEHISPASPASVQQSNSLPRLPKPVDLPPPEAELLMSELIPL
jgi:hypothetical protein